MNKTALRSRLLAERQAMSPTLYAQASIQLCQQVETWLDEALASPTFPVSRPPLQIGAYWPFRQEPDIVPLLQRLHAAGHAISLPAAPQKNANLTFLPWSPRSVMQTNAYGLASPLVHQDTSDNAAHHAVMPQLLLIPCVGADAAGYRLGYGGGFYDRTLASWAAQGHAVYTIGLCFDRGLLPSLPHEAHDQPLHTMVTESRRLLISQNP